MKLKDLCCHQYFLIFQQSSLKVEALHSMKEDVPSKVYFLDPTKAFIRSRGKDLTIVSFGPSVKNAIEVSYMLKLQKKISVEIIDLKDLLILLMKKQL